MLDQFDEEVVAFGSITMLWQKCDSVPGAVSAIVCNRKAADGSSLCSLKL